MFNPFFKKVKIPTETCLTDDLLLPAAMASSSAVPDKGRIKIEDLLESVADAVSAIVLFASDMKNDGKLITHMRGGISGLKDATEFLITEAMATVNAWKGIGNPGAH